jgi:hypothetical protein
VFGFSLELGAWDLEFSTAKVHGQDITLHIFWRIEISPPVQP